MNPIHSEENRGLSHVSEAWRRAAAVHVRTLVGGLGSRYLAPWMAAFGTLAYVPLIWSMFRIYSRNIEARRRENAAFQRFFTRLRDRQNRYFTCPRCRQVVRVPRGKGRINIRCPKCGEQFIKKT